MFKKNTLQGRITFSLFLVMIPILILCFFLYIFNQERSIEYINTTFQQNFLYVTENISVILNRLNYTAQTAFALENEVEIDASGNVDIPFEGQLCADLDALEQRIVPQVTVLFYIKGDNQIYSSQGKMLYGDYESQNLQDFNLSLSAFYTTLNTVTVSTLIPLISEAAPSTLNGLAYAIPFPNATISKGLLVFVLSNEVIDAEFENCLGDIAGSLYLYDSKYRLLYTSGDTSCLPANQAIRVRGTGILSMTWEGQKLILMRAMDSSQGLYWIWSTPREVFYASMEASQRLMLALITILLILTLALILWIAFFNYKPIRDLMLHVTGRGWARHHENELELIRDAYDQTVDEAEALASRLNEMTPLVAQQLIRQLIFGRLSGSEEFQALATRADMDFSRPWNVALYLLFPRQDKGAQLEQAMLAASRFVAADTFAAVGELPQENALCILLNLDAEPQAVSDAIHRHAEQLYETLAQCGAPPQVIGIGEAYRDPLKMNESFAEACAAVQLAPHHQHLWHYMSEQNADAAQQEDFHGLSPLSVSLLAEGLHRGDKVIALRALHGMLQRITDVTHSLAFFRFCSSELLTTLLHQADSLQLSIPSARIQQLITITTPSEFSQAVSALVEELCDAMLQRISDNDQKLNQELLDFILANFKRPDLSIQTVADETGIHKAQITTLIKEATGQGFVQYVSYLRHNEFKRLLLQTDATIRDLVLQVGYNDVPNFLRKFKSIEGMTPSQYRQLHGK